MLLDISKEKIINDHDKLKYMYSKVFNVDIRLINIDFHFDVDTDKDGNNIGHESMQVCIYWIDDEYNLHDEIQILDLIIRFSMVNVSKL